MKIRQERYRQDTIRHINVALKYDLRLVFTPLVDSRNLFRN